ncbi:ParB/RepB/Spo0J family partition protein [Halorubrum pallidum]|uniref:ParB/RepB/Spo0J family partition protein n=1 Tax=Halorubrum pallidum TaxID=1526114 RepID=A0ABD5SZU3_9EURY
MNTPELSIDEWDATTEKTVADKNPSYDRDEQVVVAVPKRAVQGAFPYYTGGVPLHLSRINDAGVNHIGFPTSRLEPIRHLNPVLIPLREISPSPFHSRSFSIDENREFVETIRKQGGPSKPPLVRPVHDRFEIINGHKRVWASHAAGVDAIPCRCAYVDARTAAEWWVPKHIPQYTEEQREAAVERIHDVFGDDATEILKHH